MPAGFTFFLYCVSLAIAFAVGLVIGKDNSNYWEIAKDTIPLVLSFAAIYVAAKALETFKHQHKYQERYKVLIAIYHQLIDCKSHQETLTNRNTALYMYHQEKSEEWKSRAEDWENSLKSFNNSIYQMQQCIRKSNYVLLPREYQTILSYGQALIIESNKTAAGAEHIKKALYDYRGPFDRGAQKFGAVCKEFESHLQSKLAKYQ